MRPGAPAAHTVKSKPHRVHASGLRDCARVVSLDALNCSFPMVASFDLHAKTVSIYINTQVSAKIPA
eukprot:1048379-Pyramimonas_sp.AAC.1